MRVRVAAGALRRPVDHNRARRHDVGALQRTPIARVAMLHQQEIFVALRVARGKWDGWD